MSVSALRAGLMMAAGALAVAALPLHAQLRAGGAREQPSSPLRPRTELRIDYLGGRRPGLHAGLGLSVRAGTYVRIGGNAGVGADTFGARSDRAHADLTARFLLDPYRENRVGVSLGGGIGARYGEERVRGVLLLLADVEAGGRGRWTPFLRAGIGGGARIAVGLRRASATGR